jgi:hypothetical protein
MQLILRAYLLKNKKNTHNIFKINTNPAIYPGKIVFSKKLKQINHLRIFKVGRKEIRPLRKSARIKGVSMGLNAGRRWRHVPVWSGDSIHISIHRIKYTQSRDQYPFHQEYLDILDGSIHDLRSISSFHNIHIFPACYFFWELLHYYYIFAAFCVRLNKGTQMHLVGGILLCGCRNPTGLWVEVPLFVLIIC